MKIVEATVHELLIPFESGGPHGWGSNEWKEMPFVLLEVRTESGLVGWGEGFCYGKSRSTALVLREIIAPQILGFDARHIAGINHDLLRNNVRTGPFLNAISAVDIALWDITGKAAGLPLHQILGGGMHDKLPVFASFFRFEDPGLVREMCSQALSEGMCWLKLHEHQEDCISAAREIANDIPLIVDVNCAWSPTEALAMLEKLKQYQLHWLEEPIYPPEDLRSLKALRSHGIPFALGENAATLIEFQGMLDSGSVDYVLPGITKIGGITAVRKVFALAEARNVTAIPWTPMYGPGLLASLHFMATLPKPIPVEYFYYKSIEGLPYADDATPKNGFISVPQGPGLGFDPDPEILRRYSV